MQITKVENLDALVNLETLDLSFNRIAVIDGLSSLKKLKMLFFVHNKIEKIEGLSEVNSQARLFMHKYFYNCINSRVAALLHYSLELLPVLSIFIAIL